MERYVVENYEPEVNKKGAGGRIGPRSRRILDVNVKIRDISTETRTDFDAEGPLRRWARRRTASEDVGDVHEPAGDSSEPIVVEKMLLADEDSDYSGLLSSGVSEALRRRALR